MFALTIHKIKKIYHFKLLNHQILQVSFLFFINSGVKVKFSSAAVGGQPSKEQESTSSGLINSVVIAEQQPSAVKVKSDDHDSIIILLILILIILILIFIRYLIKDFSAYCKRRYATRVIAERV